MRYHDWRFDIIDDLDNLRLNQYGERNYDNPVNVHDKPDVEFNDDGSVHINTPGTYIFYWEDNKLSYAVRIVNGIVVSEHSADGNGPDDSALD